jgi:STE24 endopeptidase
MLTISAIAAYFIVTKPEISRVFGFENVNTVFGIYVLFIMLSPISLIFRIPVNILSRKHEYEADAFERSQVGKETAVSALKKLYREDLGNLTPHPFVVMMEHSHPPLSERLTALESQVANISDQGKT